MRDNRSIETLISNVKVYTADGEAVNAQSTGEEGNYFSDAITDTAEQLDLLPSSMLTEIAQNENPLAIGILWGFEGGMRAWETGIFTKHGAYRDDIRASAFYLTQGLRMGGGRYVDLADAPDGRRYSGAIGINWSRAEFKRQSAEYGPAMGKQYSLIHEIAHHWLTDCPSSRIKEFETKFLQAMRLDMAGVSSPLRSYVASLRDAHDAQQEYFAFCLEMICGGQKKLYPSDKTELFDFQKCPNIIATLVECFPDLEPKISMLQQTQQKSMRSI